MAKTRTGLIAALDIGSSKIACFIAHGGANGSIRVIGVGQHASSGIRYGSIVGMEDAEKSILTTVSAAEQLAGERLRSVVVNVSGGNPASRVCGVQVPISGHEVSDADLRRAHGHGVADDEPDNRELIHCIPVGYSVDGSRGIRDPRGMYGEKLGVKMHVVTTAAGALRNMSICVGRCHLDIEDAVVSPYASGLACLVEDEMDLGVTVVDMGGGTTTIAVFYDGHVMHTDAVPIGGDHVTNDIARGLSTPLFHAERMKTLYGSAIPSPSDEHELIDVPLVGEEHHAQPNHVPRSMLVGIIRPRLEETFELVRSKLESSNLAKIAGRRMVLTGGASQLHGVRELAALVLEKQVRMGRPLRINGLADATSGPAFSTSAGLLRYAVEKRNRMDDGAGLPFEAHSERFGRIGQWLRENF